MPLIQSVERALAIIDLFSEQKVELNLADISTQTGLHKSTLHSLLKTLQVHGYIDQAESNGPYRLGLKLLERGYLVTRSRDFVSIARPYLTELSVQTGQTTHLGVLDGTSGVYIDKVEGERSIIGYSRVGRRVPIHSTAIGKILLAFQPPAAMDKILTGYVFEPFTENTVKTRQDFEAVLVDVRARGYAVDEQENVRGVRCAAIPVWNHAGQLVAAISISTVVENVTHDEFARYIDALRDIGVRVSRDFGYSQHA